MERREELHPIGAYHHIVAVAQPPASLDIDGGFDITGHAIPQHILRAGVQAWQIPVVDRAVADAVAKLVREGRPKTGRGQVIARSARARASSTASYIASCCPFGLPRK